ncbi:MAG: hypothetical protein ACU833_03305 [Gammaproteobacteria bacterium]
MKIVWTVFLIGLVLLYFVNAALRIEIMNLEMLTHSLIRFFIGFFILGIWCLSSQKLKLKYSIYLILALLLGDDAYDHYRNVDSLTPEIFLQGMYMLIWGAVTGYVFMKRLKKRREQTLGG